jgi:hypothetical protein
MKRKEKEMNAPDNSHFAVYYDKNGEIIEVHGPNYKVIKQEHTKDQNHLKDNPLSAINGLKVNLLLFKQGSSVPCCIQDNNGHLWCWPPCA